MRESAVNRFRLRRASRLRLFQRHGRRRAPSERFLLVLGVFTDETRCVTIWAPLKRAAVVPLRIRRRFLSRKLYILQRRLSPRWRIFARHSSRFADTAGRHLAGDEDAREGDVLFTSSRTTKAGRRTRRSRTERRRSGYAHDGPLPAGTHDIRLSYTAPASPWHPAFPAAALLTRMVPSRAVCCFLALTLGAVEATGD